MNIWILDLQPGFNVCFFHHIGTVSFYRLNKQFRDISLVNACIPAIIQCFKPSATHHHNLSIFIVRMLYFCPILLYNKLNLPITADLRRIKIFIWKLRLCFFIINAHSFGCASLLYDIIHLKIMGIKIQNWYIFWN